MNRRVVVTLEVEVPPSAADAMDVACDLVRCCVIDRSAIRSVTVVSAREVPSADRLPAPSRGLAPPPRFTRVGEGD